MYPDPDTAMRIEKLKNQHSYYPKYMPANIDWIMGSTKGRRDSIIHKFMVPICY